MRAADGGRLGGCGCAAAPLAPQANPDVVLDVGQTVQVPAWQPDGTALVRYRGADWLAVASGPHGQRRPGPHRIRAVQGNRLVIEPVDHP